MNTLRVFLLVLIIIGLGLLATQRLWLPPLVDGIVGWQNKSESMVVPLPQATSTSVTPDNTISIPEDWMLATTSSGNEFRYPNPLPTTYVSSVDWPPQVIVSVGTLSCTEGDMASHSGEVTHAELETIGTKQYCVSQSSEGAAGSTYTSYQYATENNGSVVSVSFTLRTPQCLNYDEPKQSECIAEQAQFNVEKLATTILSSVQN